MNRNRIPQPGVFQYGRGASREPEFSSMSRSPHISPKIALLAGAVAAFGFAASAPAQEYTYSYRTAPGYYGPPPEEVIIEAPRYHAPQRSTIGAPIEDVAMSRTIRFDDLDLRTPWGARAL